MGMYKQWAEEITTIVESNPAIRNRLRELIKPLAEQDEAYRANEAAGPFDDPCDVLTYRIPGTIITRLDAREEVDLTALPALESEQAERQRQAIMLVGIHDHSGAVKISAGIWPPELLDRVWQRLQSDPPNGPCDTVIKKAMAWLRGGLAGEVGGAGIIHIDLSQWKGKKSRTLMQRLLEDEQREGVKVIPKWYGTVRELRRILKDKGLATVAKAITPVPRKTRVYCLDIPCDEITWKK